jgi:hypothetical protein
MTHAYTIGVGTVGGGLSFSHDGAETWNRTQAPAPWPVTHEADAKLDAVHEST